MKGVFSEYGIFIAEIIVGFTAIGLLALTFDQLQPVLSAGMSRLIGG